MTELGRLEWKNFQKLIIAPGRVLGSLDKVKETKTRLYLRKHLQSVQN